MINPMMTSLPVVGDMVHFLPDSTLCEVIGVLPEVKPHPVIALRHPQHGDILSSERSFTFPVGNPAPQPIPKVTCVECRWVHYLAEDGTSPREEWDGDKMVEEPTASVCRQPGRVTRSPMDYVTGKKIPLSCYDINGQGTCSTFEQDPSTLEKEAK